MYSFTLQWRHNGHDGVSNHQPHDCLFNRVFRCRSKKISKLRVTGLCVGNSPMTGEFRAQMASNAENVFIWWRHHGAWGKRVKPVHFLALIYGFNPRGLSSFLECPTCGSARWRPLLAKIDVYLRIAVISSRPLWCVFVGIASWKKSSFEIQLASIFTCTGLPNHNIVQIACIIGMYCIRIILTAKTGTILSMCPANENWRYTVTVSLISWAPTQNDPC